LNYIESLPLNTSPKVFGLHENAEITTNQNRSTNFIKTIIKCNNSNQQGSDSENEVVQIIIQLIKNIPEEFDLMHIKICYPTMYD
jgi:dynein heavy chain